MAQCGFWLVSDKQWGNLWCRGFQSFGLCYNCPGKKILVAFKLALRIIFPDSTDFKTLLLCLVGLHKSYNLWDSQQLSQVDQYQTVYLLIKLIKANKSCQNMAPWTTRPYPGPNSKAETNLDFLVVRSTFPHAWKGHHPREAARADTPWLPWAPGPHSHAWKGSPPVGGNLEADTIISGLRRGSGLS